MTVQSVIPKLTSRSMTVQQQVNLEQHSDYTTGMLCKHNVARNLMGRLWMKLILLPSDQTQHVDDSLQITCWCAACRHLYRGGKGMTMHLGVFTDARITSMYSAVVRRP